MQRCIPLALACVLSVSTLAAEAGDSPSLPELALHIPQLHSDVKFSLFAPARRELAESGPEATLYWQSARVAGALEIAARSLYPQQMEKIGRFDVYLGDAGNAGSLSSASGRIVLTSAFADLNPADGWLAFVIAREMGHVLAGHHDRNAIVSMVTSALLNLIIPGSAIIKHALSLGGSQMASSSSRPQQIREADEIAVKLMAAAEYRSTSVALHMAFGPTAEQLGAGSWASDFIDSAGQLITAAREARIAAATLAREEAVVTAQRNSLAELAAVSPR